MRIAKGWKKNQGGREREKGDLECQDFSSILERLDCMMGDGWWRQEAEPKRRCSGVGDLGGRD